MSNLKKVVYLLGLMLAGLNLAATADWKLKGGLEAGWRYDSNVFKLSASQAQALKAPSPADMANGRFLDMTGPGDHIVLPVFSLALEGPGLFGKKLEVRGSVGYEVYTGSHRRNNLETVLALKQSLGKRGAVRITGRYLPKYFRKNYLLDGTADSTGQVLPEDRIYAAGIYREAALNLDFDYRLLSRKQTGVFALTAELGAGYSDRRYQTEFHGRDREAWEFQGGLGLDFGKGMELIVRYSREASKSPIVTEVLLLNEPSFNADFNADGDLLDDNVRVIGTVDRSYGADQFSGQFNFELSKATRLGFRVSRMLRRYSSRESYDGYAGRTNKRWIFRTDLDHRISTHLSLVAGFAYNSQTINRIDVTEDEADYAKSIARAGIILRF